MNKDAEEKEEEEEEGRGIRLLGELVSILDRDPLMKQVISRKPLKEVYCTELRLSALVISYAPKSEQAWSYRYWLIKLIISGVLNSKEVHLILESESDFVENIVERSHMNYRAWRHRCWLVNHMSKPQVLNELRRTHEWAESHVGDNCCFHYCRLLLLKLHQSSHHIGEVDRDISLNFFYTSFQNDTKGYEGELLLLSKEELDWNKNLITHNSGRETLWIHRRFLFLEMIQQAEVGFHCNHTLSATHCDIGVLKHGKSHQSVPFDLFLLMEQEFEFINSCINKHGTIFEDASKQKEYAAMYNMWIIFHLRQVNGSQAFIERVEKEKIKLKVLLENVCPQRTLLWEEVLSV